MSFINLYPRRIELKWRLASLDNAHVKVFSSPLTRTLDTAVIVAEELGIYTTDSRFQVGTTNLPIIRANGASKV